jgi:hypothetical protein
LKDLLPLSYDPAKVTPERIVEAVRKEGFEATIVPAPNAPTDQP